MTLRFWTAQVSYTGEDRLAVSRGGRDPFGVTFAPSVTLLKRYAELRRDGRYTRDEAMKHRAMDRVEMQQSQMTSPLAWSQLLARETATLCCFCVNPSACHRGWLAELLVALGATYEGERERR